MVDMMTMKNDRLLKRHEIESVAAIIKLLYKKIIGLCIKKLNPPKYFLASVSIIRLIANPKIKQSTYAVLPDLLSRAL